MRDRLIPIHVDHYDRDTEVAITVARSGASTEDAARVVDLVRRFRKQGMQGHRPSIRAAIMIARVVMLQGVSFDPVDRVFQRTCRDVLGLDCIDVRGPERPLSADSVEEEFSRTCDAVEAALGSSD
ncbi:MAG: hypothetical protein A2V70_02720 [Planctomycetes bacterium RBG_13_63_9]|nr:MAG: hypothetical protein A2V70_02720 [Planctomycetes bacterium RBG_13_63_9]